MSKYKYNQGSRVYFTFGETMSISGWATIVGCASDEYPEIGRQWIAKLETSISGYPFDCICIFDNMIIESPKS